MEGANESDCDQSWRGHPLDFVYRHLDKFENCQHVPPVEISFKSTVMYEFPIGVVGTTKAPKPYAKEKKCDYPHVGLPNAVECFVCSKTDNEICQLSNRWQMIKAALTEPIDTVQELQDAILAYNPEFKEQCHFRALHTLLMDDLEVEEFFKDLLPRIIKLAFQLPDLIQAPIPLLERNSNHSISLTQQQVSCLLANAFLCTFPHRSTEHSAYESYSDINFHKLFEESESVATEKLKCILNYFRRVCPTLTDNSNVPTGVVTFIRQSLYPYDFPDWSTFDKTFESTILHIDAAGFIENGIGLLQVGFANKYVGSEVFNASCMQEEIRFSINPELIVAKLFTEYLMSNEALFMIGCEQYNNYTGYGSSFKWTGNHIDETPRDGSKRRQIYIVAIDALDFRHRAVNTQYSENSIYRELNKAYVGFLYQNSKPAAGIATGNWGCGRFCGDPRLKALLQLMVACVTDRALVYYTFFDEALRDDIFKMCKFLKKRKIRVCDLFNVLIEFCSQNPDSNKLYRYIKYRLRDPV